MLQIDVCLQCDESPIFCRILHVVSFFFDMSLILLLLRYYANFLLATFICIFMSTRFGTCVGHSANSFVLKTVSFVSFLFS